MNRVFKNLFLFTAYTAYKICEIECVFILIFCNFLIPIINSREYCIRYFPVERIPQIISKIKAKIDYNSNGKLAFLNALIPMHFDKTVWFSASWVWKLMFMFNFGKFRLILRTLKSPKNWFSPNQYLTIYRASV